jgi:chorismate synthase
MLRFSTAGESHGEALIAIISGIPAGLAVDAATVDRELWRRQQGYGRGARMKMERDAAHFISGVRHGKTIGSPIAIRLENKDWKNWTEALPVAAGDSAKHKSVDAPRPGHADLAGALKYNFRDARYVLERASARESAARVAAGAIARIFLRALGIEIASHVIAVGGVQLDRAYGWEELAALRERDEIVLNCTDAETESRMRAEVDRAIAESDTVGGVFEVVAHGVPAGLGSFANWDERLDGRLAGAVMSLPAVKAVEIGRGVASASSFGSDVHDAIHYSEGENSGGAGDEGMTKFRRAGNNAGGIEGGISNGEDIVVRGYMKPISTLRKPLASVSFESREAVKASYERSDVCVVPAAGVAAEAMVALTLAQAALEKFGGDSLVECERNFRGYLEQLRGY